ncbi:hypothetical protein B0T16DRAFT_513239 [Cercophora newfieldiana]|uniref:Uncharacterized protein n=1 Tax=Cercophora newfieldiana TaxID=92897 RepID=A0AA40CNV5_9PEZI|nr:hypothetical protein B0T16DRAFT_513239 [Cercophora newfieldiana]
METRRTIRGREQLRRRKGEDKFKLFRPPFFKKKDEEADEPPPSPSESEAPPPVGKGKGKGLLTFPFFTVTVGRPATSTVTAISTLTIETPASSPKSTTTAVEVPPSSSPTATKSTVIPTPPTLPSESPPMLNPPQETNAVPDDLPQGLGRLSSNQTAGIVVGSIFGFILILVAIFAFIIYRRRRPRRRYPTPLGGARYSVGHAPSRSMDAEDSMPDPGPGLHVGQTISVVTSTHPAKHKPRLHVPALHVPAWLGRVRRPPPAPGTPDSFMAQTNEKGTPYAAEDTSPLQPPPQLPRRSIISAFSWRSRPPPSAPGLKGRASPSSDGRPSRAHYRQSSNSDASQWTGAVTHRTDSGIFVPPTALTHPRLGPSRLQTEVERPSSAPKLPPKDARRTVRFSGQQVPPTASGRASLIKTISNYLQRT